MARPVKTAVEGSNDLSTGLAAGVAEPALHSTPASIREPPWDACLRHNRSAGHPAMGERVFGKDAKEIRTQVGEVFVIELEGKPGAGYVWRIRPSNARLRVEELPSQPAGTGLGAPRRQRFRIEPSEGGECQLFAEYGRSWERVPLERLDPILVRIEQSSQE